jgi:hypothetical protein
LHDKEEEKRPAKMKYVKPIEEEVEDDNQSNVSMSSARPSKQKSK